MIYKTILTCLLALPVYGIESIDLKTPILSKETLIGTNVGIRPFRKTGVRIEPESIEDKLIIHNYGYGGSGITLAFGGAKEVLKILNKQKIDTKTIAVLGGGVIGLSTAYDLMEQGYTVHLYADNHCPNLTSNVAAGIRSPLQFPTDLPVEKKQLHEKMLQSSDDRLLKSIGPDPEFAGVRFMPLYQIKTDNLPEEDEVVIHLDNGTTKKAVRKYRCQVDGGLFINDLQRKIQEKGVILEKRHFHSLQDVLQLKESVIINCMSIGSKEIFKDEEFIANRGQLIYFPFQEDLNYFYFDPLIDQINNSNNSTFFVSIYPWSDRVILGGVYEYDQEELQVDSEVIDQLIENAQRSLSRNLQEET
jgi:hypothetical protein